MFVDVHTHLDHCKFDSDRDKVIERAKEAGVSIIINNGVDVEKNRVTLEYAKKYDIVKAALGLYPVEALKLSDDEVDGELEFIKKNKNNIIAIGEVGLDFFWVKEKDKWVREREIFEKVIKVAEEIKKPIIVHSRKAEENCINMLESSKLKKIVMHCFGGSKGLIRRASDNGWYFSIPTNIVHNYHFQNLVKMVNINQILTETDAPYLSPFKDKRNEPAFVVESVKSIASIKGFEVEEVKNNIFMNYKTVFE